MQSWLVSLLLLLPPRVLEPLNMQVKCLQGLLPSFLQLTCSNDLESFPYRIFQRVYLFISERKEGKTSIGRNTDWLPLMCAPAGDLAHNPDKSPHQESSWQPFSLWTDTQSTEPHQSGPSTDFLMQGKQVHIFKCLYASAQIIRAWDCSHCRNKLLQTGWLNNRNSFSHRSGGWKSKVLAGLVSPQASLLGFQMAAF